MFGVYFSLQVPKASRASRRGNIVSFYHVLENTETDVYSEMNATGKTYSNRPLVRSLP
jgi:hypothetical protein